MCDAGSQQHVGQRSSERGDDGVDTSLIWRRNYFWWVSIFHRFHRLSVLPSNAEKNDPEVVVYCMSSYWPDRYFHSCVAAAIFSRWALKKCSLESNKIFSLVCINYSSQYKSVCVYTLKKCWQIRIPKDFYNCLDPNYDAKSLWVSGISVRGSNICIICSWAFPFWDKSVVIAAILFHFDAIDRGFVTNRPLSGYLFRK